MSRRFLNGQAEAIDRLEKMGFIVPDAEMRLSITRGLGLPTGAFNPRTLNERGANGFDMVDAPADINLWDEWEVEKNSSFVSLIEVKSTQSQGKPTLHISTNEIRIANFLGEQRYRVAIVNVLDGTIQWDSLQGIMKRARRIHSQISLRYIAPEPIAA